MKELLFNTITEDVTFVVSYEQMERTYQVALANGITRDDIAKAWSNEPHPEDAGLSFTEYNKQRHTYSAIIATFDYYARLA